MEIFLYTVHIAALYLWLIPSISSSIRQKCLDNWRCHAQLQDTYWGAKIDLSDKQWRELRGVLFLLWLVVAYTAVSRSVLFHSSPVYKNLFRLLLGLFYLIVQHGLQSLIVIALVTMSYAIVKTVDVRHIPRATWICCILIILFKESYRLRSYGLFKQWLYQIIFNNDLYGGMYSWHLPANFLVLRVVSFGCDYHDHRIVTRRAAESEYDADTSKAPTKSDSDYTLSKFLCYVFYAPLYVAGPVMSFDDFISSTNEIGSGRRTVFVPGTLQYTARWFFCMLLMEMMTLYFPFFAVVQSGLLRSLDVSEIAVVCYVLLKMMWLKFLLLWRFFRLWAMYDGVDAPENMLRCMSNNNSLSGFWRGWHASFNKWIVRYMYIPLGGRAWRVISVWPIFLFVSVWHDIELKLLVWGLLNSIFLGVEFLGSMIVRTNEFKSLHPRIAYAIRIVAGGGYIFAIIFVNLVGYAVGVVGVSSIIIKILSRQGLYVILVCFYFLSWGVRLMDYLREHGYSLHDK